MSNEDKMNNIRPPVVGIFGHIDHGKSTLVDYIRKTNTTLKEAGGITQHIGAYEVSRTLPDGQTSHLTILDTPGHEAFSGIRTRGANVADIAVLVVSAEDGVKPQTLEVYKHIKASEIPYLVAITKIDKPAADIDRTKQNLAENGIYVEGFGGDVSVVELSGKTGQGVDDLLDMISLMASLEEKVGDKEALGEGVIIESRLDAKRGIVGVGIIKNGTVRTGLFASSEGTIASLRFILDAENNMVEELSFSSPIQIVGWDKIPKVGQAFKTFLKKDEAVAYAENNANNDLEDKGKSYSTEVSLPLIIKADTAGSLEAIEGELKKISNEKILPRVILSGVGSVNEKDAKSALTSPGTIIMSFNSKIDSQAAALTERSGIEILSFSIIYELTDKVKELLKEREPKTEVEEVTGAAKILKIFNTSKGKQVIGGRVTTGTIEKNSSVKIMRREAEIGDGKIKELQHAKVATSSVQEGEEFGAMIESKLELVPGDMIQAVTKVVK